LTPRSTLFPYTTLFRSEGEGQILTHVVMLLWLVTLAAMLAAALAVGACSAASVIERQVEIGLMKALGAGSATVAFLLAAEQLLLDRKSTRLNSSHVSIS